MPISASLLITTLLFFERKAKQHHIAVTKELSVWELCSQLDLSGSIILSGCLSVLLIPFSLVGTKSSSWSSWWIIASIVIGLAALSGLVVYEGFVAKYPILPAHYLRNASIVICCLLGLLDSFGSQATHTYLYSWATVVHDMGPRQATFLNYTNGVCQAVFGCIAGLIMWKPRNTSGSLCLVPPSKWSGMD